MDIADVKMDPQFLEGLMLLMKKKYWDGFKKGGEKKKKENLFVRFSSGDQEYLS